jgi:predicted PhzF superfamily epimerase YddE/YHI9
MTNKHQIFQIDAFTDRAFSGNPAAVCMPAQPCEAEWMEKLAMELNQSSTTFIEDRGDSFAIRWFSRRGGELALNGTGTLCSAHVLWECGRVSRDQELKFESRGGPLSACWDDGWIEMSFPAGSLSPVEPPVDLLAGLGATPTMVFRSNRNVHALFESEAAVRALEPDYPVLARVEAHGIIATAADANSQFDFISRYFAPAGGVNEDPVNGSSHAELGPFWQARLGRDVLLAQQASPRGGLLRLRPQGDRVVIAGHAVTVARGELA